MDQYPPKRFEISKFTFVFFALAISIFGWGLQSKLSLYTPHTLTRPLPKGKLVLRDEKDAAAEDRLLEYGTPIPGPETNLPQGALLLFALAAVVLSSNRIKGLWDLQRAERPRIPGSGMPLNALFFRPPPVMA